MEAYKQFLQIDNLLNADQLDEITGMLSMANFVDGAYSATSAAKLVKKNLQIDPNQNASMLEELVMQAIGSNQQIQEMLLPKLILPPTFSRYEPGMTYGMHVDNPLMAKPQFPPLRTDLGMTVFLSDPDSYEGGELTIHTPTGTYTFKPTKGSAVIYPTMYIHGVAPITKGTRDAAVTWLQSMVRDPNQRAILYSLKSVHNNMVSTDYDKQEALRLLQSYSNLMRMWSEL